MENNENWCDEFDKKFPTYPPDENLIPSDAVKSFITNLLREQARAAMKSLEEKELARHKWCAVQNMKDSGWNAACAALKAHFAGEGIVID